MCCDHFSKDAFIDPNAAESLLKLKKYPSIPIPTIFENNLLSTVEKVSKNPEKFVSYSKHTAYDTSNPEHREILQKRLKVREEARNIDPSEMNEEYLEEIEIERDTEVLESVDINTFCRLCGKNNTDMISIFDFNGELHPDTKCFRLMPQGMISFNDGLPQYACFECIDKLQSCLSIIDGFVANQTMFVTE